MWGLCATTYLCPLLKQQLGRTNPHCYIQQPLLYSRIPSCVSSSTVTPSWRCRALSCPPNYCPQHRETVVLLRQPQGLSNKIMISFACMYGVRERYLGSAKKVRLLQFRVLQFWQVSPTTCSHCLLTQQAACCYRNPSPGWYSCTICAQSSSWAAAANRGGTEWNCKHTLCTGFRAPCTTEHCSRKTWEGTWHSKFRVCFLTMKETADVLSCWTAWWGACLPAMLHSLADNPCPALAEAKPGLPPLALPASAVTASVSSSVKMPGVHFMTFTMEVFP